MHFLVGISYKLPLSWNQKSSVLKQYCPLNAHNFLAVYNFPWKVKFTVTIRLFLSKQCFECNLQANFRKKGGGMKSLNCKDLFKT